MVTCVKNSIYQYVFFLYKFSSKQTLFTFIQQNEILMYLLESYSCNILPHVDN